MHNSKCRSPKSSHRPAKPTEITLKTVLTIPHLAPHNPPDAPTQMNGNERK